MSQQVFPTKGNLMKLKKSLALARVGYDLLDRKRNILIRETMSLIDRAGSIQTEINESYINAYKALQTANIDLGIVEEYARSVPVENGLGVSSRSVMGVEIPTVTLNSSGVKNYFGYRKTSFQLDKAYIEFDNVKRRTAELAEIENSVYRLAEGLRKTQTRANALKHIVIPRFETQIKAITAALDEKEREEFSRLKVIKKIVK
ncbi:MAG: V-type ATP synthase subunit D [Acutalibacteraceae bacterium]